MLSFSQNSDFLLGDTYGEDRMNGWLATASLPRYLLLD